LFYQLLANPHYYKELQVHVDGLCATGALVYEVVQRSAVLDAYINEAMRLEPPIPYQNQRIVPRSGVTYGGVFIPGGTHVRTALYTIARLPENFSDPDAFHPERWLAQARTSGENFNAKASTPFIQGPYHCVGRNFAMAEMRWTVARIVHRYDMCLIDQFDKIAFERSIEDRSVLEIEGSLDVLIQRRS
jgi:cytochrome P450